jgi:hypothetical protein
MKIALLILLNLVALPAWSTPSHCDQYKEVKARLAGVREQDVDRLIQDTEWLDEHYERKDRQGLGLNILKLMVMGINWSSFIFIPTRVETATMTGYYSRNPENFVRFLQLETRFACNYLRMSGSDADRLRAVTHEAWRKINRNYINQVIRRNDQAHRR